MEQKTTAFLQVVLLGQSCHNWVVMWKQVGTPVGQECYFLLLPGRGRKPFVWV